MSTNGNTMTILFVFFLSVIIKCQNTYQDIFNNGLTCKTGRIQSPIELSDESSKYSQEHLLTNIDYSTLNNVYVNFNDRILKVFQNDQNFPNFGNVIYKKNGYLSQFQLIDIEFYSPAEHRINSKGSLIAPDIEIKLIHKKIDNFYSTTNELRNFTEPNSYLIISLLYKTNSTFSDNGFLTDLIIVNNPTKSPMIMKSIDFDKYGLMNNNRYYMYDGSFSYFPCDENVSYIVVRDPFFINQSDVNNIISSYNNKYSSPDVNKAIAKPFGRPVYRNFITLNSFFTKYKTFLALIILFLF